MDPLKVGSWLRPYVYVEAIGEIGEGFDSYGVLHGDCAPKHLVLRRDGTRLANAREGSDDEST